MLLLKAKRLWVHPAECTDEEAIDLEASENVHRRDVNRTETLANASKAKAALLRQDATASGNTVAASEQTIKAVARRAVAKAAGVTPAAVKRAEQRAAAKDPAPAGHGAQGDPASASPTPARETPDGDGSIRPTLRPPEGFDVAGLGMDQGEIARVLAVADLLGTWERSATAVVTQLTKQGEQLAEGHRQRIRAAAQALGHAVRDAVPVMRCLYCKGHPQLVANCFPCGQTGTMGRNDGVNAPAELRTRGKDARVAVNGAYVLYDAAGAALKGAPAKPTKPMGMGHALEPLMRDRPKRVSVQDEQGRELTIERDEELAF
jgi:hypothetical protein